LECQFVAVQSRDFYRNLVLLKGRSTEPVAIVAAISTEQIGLRRSEYVKISFRTDFIEHRSGFIYMIWGYKDIYLGLV